MVIKRNISKLILLDEIDTDTAKWMKKTDKNETCKSFEMGLENGGE